MAIAQNKEVYIDFTKEPWAPQFAKTTHAVATAANNQEDFCWVGGNKYIEWIQTGATGMDAATFFIPQTATTFGWAVPKADADDMGIEITMGMAASSSLGARAFTVGTDPAFFCRVKAVVTTLANIDVFGVGFRELGAYVDITEPALMGSVYDEKAAIAVNDNAGAVVSHFSVAGADTPTTATGTPIVSAQAFEFMVQVDGDGVCSYYIALDADTTPLGSSPTADVLLSVPTQTLTAATVVVPYIVYVDTGADSPNVVLQEWEVGYVRS